MHDYDPAHEELGEIYTATVTDLISRKEIGCFSFHAQSIEEARPLGWRIAGKRYCPDIHVRIERATQ